MPMFSIHTKALRLVHSRYIVKAGSKKIAEALYHKGKANLCSDESIGKPVPGTEILEIEEV